MSKKISKRRSSNDVLTIGIDLGDRKGAFLMYRETSLKKDVCA